MRRIILAATLIGFAQVAWSELKDGALAYSRGDFAVAVRELRPLADQGNATAQYLLGAALLNARPPVYDLPGAEAWLRKSADQGNLAAMRDLGKLSWFAKSPPDIVQAVEWLVRGSERGDAESQHLLGILYLEGKATERKPAEAYKWLLLSSERGHVLSAVILRESRDKFSDQDRAEGQALATAWKPVR
jgi:TPR repeat protein